MRAYRFGAGLFAVAFAARLVAALWLAGEPVWDGHYYDFGARRIAAGQGYSDEVMVAGVPVWHPWCHYPVGYSAFLAAFYRLLGSHHHVAGLANALVGAGLAVVTYALARHGLSESRARVAGVLVALHPGLVAYAALVMTEPLAALLTLVAFWIAVAGSPSRDRFLGAALCLGVAALVRPQALLCAPFLALAAPLAAGTSAPWAKRGAWALMACGIALTPVLPWTARNCKVMDGCALVSTNAGWNLAIGAFPRATGRFETLRSSDGCREVTGQVQQDRCWLEYGMASVKAAPRRWLGLMPAKLGFTFDHESFAVEYLHEARPALWPEARRALGRGVLTGVHRLLVAAAALGCVALGATRRGLLVQGVLSAALAGLAWLAMGNTPVFWPLVIFTAVVPWLPVPGRAPWPPALLLPVALLATTIVTHAVFFGEDRYHLVVTPVLAILAAAIGRVGMLDPSDGRERTCASTTDAG